MIQNKSIFKNRSIQLLGFMCVLQLYLVIEQIIPAYEKFPYYEAKIEVSKQEKLTLEVNHDHLAYYQEKRHDSQSKLEGYINHISELKKQGHLQNQLNLLFQSSGLEVASQQIKYDYKQADLSLVLITLSLKGSYSQIAAFLEKAHNLDQFTTISDLELVNQSPLSANPEILMNMVLTVYLPKIL